MAEDRRCRDSWTRISLFFATIRQKPIGAGTSVLGEMNRRRADPGMLVLVGTPNSRRIEPRPAERWPPQSAHCLPTPDFTPPGHTGGCRGPQAKHVLSCPRPLLVRPVLGKPPLTSTGPSLQAGPPAPSKFAVSFVWPAAGLRATGGSSESIGKTGGHWASLPVQLNLQLWSQISLGFLSTPV